MKRLSKKGFNLVELMIVIFIVSTLFAGGYVLLSTGQATWFTTDVQIQLQENLRDTIERVLLELRQTSSTQYQLFDGTGPGNTDIIRFSIPIVCQANSSLINNNGDVSYWRAPLTWGCNSSACMDADNDCATVDYKYLEYKLDNSNNLIRTVINNVGGQVRQDMFAKNITDFQIVTNGRLITLTVTAQKATPFKRTLSSQLSVLTYLRN